MTMSSTAPPAQRIFDFSAFRSVKAYLVFHPGADDVMRNRNRRRRGQPLRMLAHEHRLNLALAEPAGILQFLPINHNLVRQRPGVATDHQRSRKRPWLRCKINHLATGNADFLPRFSVHRILDRFTRLNISRETRPHGRYKAGRAAEQAPLPVARQHDHYGIGARKVLRLALRAVATPAATDESCRSATV